MGEVGPCAAGLQLGLQQRAGHSGPGAPSPDHRDLEVRDVLRRAALQPQRPENPGKHGRAGALDVVVEAEVLVPVFVQQRRGLVGSEVLELDQRRAVLLEDCLRPCCGQVRAFLKGATGAEQTEQQ